jgi:hypothetical protein
MFNHNKATENLGGHFVVNVMFMEDITVRQPDQRNARRLVHKYAVSIPQSKWRAVKLFTCRAEDSCFKDESKRRRGTFITFKGETRQAGTLSNSYQV